MASRNITRIVKHPMFGKQGRKGTPHSSSGRGIIPLITTEEVDRIAREIPPEFDDLPCPSREEVVCILRYVGAL